MLSHPLSSQQHPVVQISSQHASSQQEEVPPKRSAKQLPLAWTFDVDTPDNPQTRVATIKHLL
ncbi:hypothetical protein RSSM_02620 [Rhodopirellula sallentina SM41]|uniref:Uncharacterized protein n=1 Tax=Rhodopirellula sallentina SM41 TaxID=1263870 RepID=M5UDL3_9BACT|nr:hypothetical protein RSSM_02620 [Rhodopirellula sallentina SM41]